MRAARTATTARTSWTALAAVLLVACGSGGSAASAPAPKAVVPRPVVRGPAGAPADARLVFRSGRTAELLAASRSGPGSVAGAAVLATLEKACALDLARAVTSIEGFVTDASAVRVEIGGSLTLKEAACLAEAFGVEGVPSVAKDARRVELGDVVITARDGGGVVVATKGAEPADEAKSPLLERIAGLDGALVMAARTEGGLVDASMKLEAGGATLRLTPPPANVDALAKVFEDGLARARAAGDTGLGVKITRAGGAVELGLHDPGPGLALALRRYVVQAFKVPSASMAPTVMVGDHLFVAKDPSPPARGDVVTFEAIRGQEFVKRVVAVAGDRVQLEKDRLHVNDVPAKLTRLREVTLPGTGDDDPPQRGVVYREELDGHARTIVITQGHDGFGADAPEIVVPPGHVFVLGDNRRNSHDSRALGPIPNDKIRSRAGVVWLPATGGWQRFLTPVR